MTSKKLQKFKIEFTVIILICLTAVTASEVFAIFRKKTAGYNEWKEGTDSFTIPPSLCHVGESSSMTCARFNAKTERYNSNPCHCSCSSKNATFMFAEDQWRCTKNSDVRDLLGYTFLRYRLFYGENKDSPLPMLDTSDEKRIDILSPQSVKNCRIDKSASMYIGCDGVEVPFNSSQFTINEHGRSDADGGIQYYLKVNSGESGTDAVSGHIIKLSVRCDRVLFTGASRYHTRSLLFKYVGNVTCSNLQSSKQGLTNERQIYTTLLPSTTLHAITATKSTKTGSLVASPVSTVTTFPTEISTQSAFPESSPNVSVTSTTTSVIPRTVVVPLPTKSSRDIKPTVFSSDVSTQPTAGSERGSGDDKLLSPSLLAGVIGLIAFVLVVIIIGFLVYRRHNLNKTPRASTINIDKTKWESVILSPQINTAYTPDDQDLYRSLSIEEPPIYGIHYKVPNCPSTEVILSNLDTQSSKADTAEEHYASLNNREKQHIYGHRDTQEPLYTVLEKPLSEEEIIYECYGPTGEKPVSDDVEPIYNVLEEPCIEGPDGPVIDGAEPVYNVLEDPNIEVSEGSDHYGAKSGEGPFSINTLDKSSQDCIVETNNDSQLINEPIYNNLEDGSHQNYPSLTTEDEFVSTDFVKNVLKELVLE